MKDDLFYWCEMNLLKTSVTAELFKKNLKDEKETPTLHATMGCFAIGFATSLLLGLFLIFDEKPISNQFVISVGSLWLLGECIFRPMG